MLHFTLAKAVMAGKGGEKNKCAFQTVSSSAVSVRLLVHEKPIAIKGFQHKPSSSRPELGCAGAPWGENNGEKGQQ